ncbi:S1-like domain-containing RNA-binding protein [uncultured Alistipes sp.]|uniref:CvfB family protein n=1 Tax=uncultured Alistipes sp. TaxID=538949 RepID=UPI00260BA37D|nr:S1-like domain-containing RNA-binding protein [uncultured Alistipes sp.]
MPTAGHYHTLRVNRISDHGLYLADEQGEEVLLPNRYVSMNDKPGDMLEVFVYHDSENRPVATTERPLAAAGQAAFLEVVDKTIHGAFLDWGLPAKHLFLPNRNQQTRMEIGRRYVVFLYTDNLTGRVVASTFLKGFVRNDEITVAPGQQVDILVAQENPLGFRVIVDNRHWGMIYRNQIFHPVAVGDRMQAFVVRITDDRRIDLSLQRQGYDEIREAAERLLGLLSEHGGTLPLCDDSDPETVRSMTRMSKKTFKRSVGYLLKQGRIVMENGSIRSK